MQTQHIVYFILFAVCAVQIALMLGFTRLRDGHLPGSNGWTLCSTGIVLSAACAVLSAVAIPLVLRIYLE